MSVQDHEEMYWPFHCKESLSKNLSSFSLIIDILYFNCGKGFVSLL
jgi:hypothetical protein